jgi:hypothetical protein
MIMIRSNSVAYATTTTYQYYAAVVSDNFLQGANWTTSALIQTPNHIPISAEWPTWLEDVQKGKTQQHSRLTRKLLTTDKGDIQLKKLDNRACVETYTTPFVTRNGNLILTVDHQKANTSNYFNSSLLLLYQTDYSNRQDTKSHAYTSYSWMCSKTAFEAGWNNPDTLRCSTILDDPSSFVLSGGIPVKSDRYKTIPYDYEDRDLPINACYTQGIEQNCTVEASIALLGIVIAFITCKTLCMVWILWRLKETPLAVLGDAIASFMTQSDDLTKDACLVPPDPSAG